MSFKYYMGYAWFIFISILAIFMAGLFWHADTWMPKAAVPITLTDNFNQTVSIFAGDGSGSGVLINSFSVLTACHVAMKNECKDLYPTPSEHLVVVVGGKTFFGVVTKFDAYADLALIRLSSWQSGDLVTNVTPVTFSCDKLTISRSMYYGIGHPYAMEKVIRMGILGAETPSLAQWLKLTADAPFAHELHSEFVGMMWRERKYFNVFDLRLDPGNSGGGVFDEKGHLVGIVSHITKFPEDLPMAGPDKRAIGVPSGFSYSTKPERICEFMEGIK